MPEKPTYAQLEQRIKALEEEALECKRREDELREQARKYSANSVRRRIGRPNTGAAPAWVSRSPKRLMLNIQFQGGIS